MESGNDDGLILNLHDDSWDLIMDGLELLQENRDLEEEQFEDANEATKNEIFLIYSLIYHMKRISAKTVCGKTKVFRLKESKSSTLEIRQVSQEETIPSDEKQSSNSGTAARKESLFEIVKRERKIETE
jgi:hypothetical protein